MYHCSTVFHHLFYHSSQIIIETRFLFLQQWFSQVITKIVDVVHYQYFVVTCYFSQGVVFPTASMVCGENISLCIMYNSCWGKEQV